MSPGRAWGQHCPRRCHCLVSPSGSACRVAVLAWGHLHHWAPRALSLADRPESHLCGLLLNGSVLICQKSESLGAVTLAPGTVSWPCSHQAWASLEATTAQPADLPLLSGCDRTGHQAQRDWPLTLAVEETPELGTASPSPPRTSGEWLRTVLGASCHSHKVLDPRGWCTGDQRRGEAPVVGLGLARPPGPGREVALMSPSSPRKGAWSLKVPAQEGGVPPGLPPARAGCHPGL